MKIIKLALLSILLPVICSAQTIQGYDALGLAMYCKRYLNAPKLPALSTLMNTFGDPFPCIEKRMSQECLKLIQIDLIDATCWRNNSCPSGVPRPNDLNEIKSRAKKVQLLKNKLSFCNTEWWLSPALEHDEKNPQTVTAMLKAAQEGCPECKVINSPFSGARPPQYPLELHGTKVKAFSVSGDGASIFDGDNLKSDNNGFEHRVSGEHTTFAWFNELNLRCTGENKPPPPLKRTEKPSSELFVQAYLVLQPEQNRSNLPSKCKFLREIEANKEINKPNAEAYCNGQIGENDSRGNKPLLIIKKQGQVNEKLNVLNSNGKIVGCFKYYGSYDGLPNTHRWYMGNCSGQYASQLYKDLGNSEWGYLQLGGGKCLRFNAIRRQGTYR